MNYITPTKNIAEGAKNDLCVYVSPTKNITKLFFHKIFQARGSQISPFFFF